MGKIYIERKGNIGEHWQASSWKISSNIATEGKAVFLQ